MRVSEFRTDVPDWVMQNWLTRCPYCGSYIIDNSDTGVTTARKCGNKNCPEHMAHKVKSLTDFLNIKGIGPKTARKIIQQNKFKSHFDFLEMWCKDNKPEASLAEIATLMEIEEIGAQTAEKELSQYDSFESYFSYCRDPLPQLVMYKEELIDAQRFFTIKPPLSPRQMLVMATGAFHGYTNRTMFFDMINRKYGHYIHIVQSGKRKTGVSFLLKENDAVDHSKTAIARQCNIPIITPAEFLQIMEDTFPYTGESQ